MDTTSKVTGRVVSGDFNRDGRLDELAALYDYGNGQTRIHVWKTDQNSFVYQGADSWWLTCAYKPVWIFTKGKQMKDLGDEVISESDQLGASELFIYPNPAQDMIEVEYTDLKQKEMPFQITAVSGEIVLKGITSGTIDISSLKDGIYFISLMNQGRNVTQKLVKK